MNRTLEDWANTLLDDCSPEALLIFSDWLELDQDDEELAQAARGVRELLVGNQRRPDNDGSGFCWVANFPDTRSHLRKGVFDGLAKRGHRHFERWYDFTPETRATAHLTALLDAAQAWAKCNPESLTKGKVTT